jgi:hypothetical protein
MVSRNGMTVNASSAKSHNIEPLTLSELSSHKHISTGAAKMPQLSEPSSPKRVSKKRTSPDSTSSPKQPRKKGKMNDATSTDAAALQTSARDNIMCSSSGSSLTSSGVERRKAKTTSARRPGRIARTVSVKAKDDSKLSSSSKESQPSSSKDKIGSQNIPPRQGSGVGHMPYTDAPVRCY